MFIRRLIIERYRGLESLTWDPPRRINCLIGPGDAGKSTILSSIERVFDPRASSTASEFDYYRREVERGFQIRAVLGELDEDYLAALRNPPLMGWLNSQHRWLPDEDGAEPVLVARVAGSPDLDVTHELVTPPGADDVPFTPSMRRRLLLSRIASGVRAAAELRLGRGSLLDRHLNAAEFQGQLRSAAAGALAGLELPADAERSMSELTRLFEDSGLPEDLSLGIITPQGWSLLGLLGLVEGAESSQAIPLAFAGAGTRQLAMFRLAAGLMGASPVVLMDEPELGLEPYRQRKLVSEIRQAVGERGQAFLTTHSPAVLETLKDGEVSRLTPRNNPIALKGRHAQKVQAEAPDLLLSRLPILCEGDTEAGLLNPIFESYARENGLGSIDAMGIRLVGRSGQPQILAEAEELLGLGLSLGVFVDRETTHTGRRRRIARNPRCAFASWDSVRNVEEAVCEWLSFENLSEVIKLAADLRGRAEQDLLQQVGEFIGSPGRASLPELLTSHDEEEVRAALSRAMLSKNNPWFKTEPSGRGLGSFLLAVGLPDRMQTLFHGLWGEVVNLGGWVPRR